MKNCKLGIKSIAEKQKRKLAEKDKIKDWTTLVNNLQNITLVQKGKAHWAYQA